jgi:L-asparaginase
LAEAGVNLNFDEDAIAELPKGELKLYKKIDTHVAILKIFPGMGTDVIRAVAGIKGLKALIIETYGSGNAPTDGAFIGEIKKALESGLIVFNVTQCYGGAVEQGKYETSVALDEVGVIGGSDITTEAAIAKLMFLLGNYKDRSEIVKKLKKPLRGEMTL